jgi:hypothetical protein
MVSAQWEARFGHCEHILMPKASEPRLVEDGFTGQIQKRARIAIGHVDPRAPRPRRAPVRYAFSKSRTTGEPLIHRFLFLPIKNGKAVRKMSSTASPAFLDLTLSST